MRFMIIRKADPQTEAGAMPSEQLIADMGRYNEDMVNAGVMLAGEGLQPSAKGFRVTFRDGKPTTILDGPFAETKEIVAGFTIIEVTSRDEALAWVRRWPSSDGDGNVELEVRQHYEAGDFGNELTPGLRDAEERLRAEIAAKRRG